MTLHQLVVLNYSVYTCTLYMSSQLLQGTVYVGINMHMFQKQDVLTVAVLYVCITNKTILLLTQYYYTVF